MKRQFLQVFCGFNAPFQEGRENSRHLQRANFAVQRDGEGALFVYKTRDEQTKNHQNDDDGTDGRMYEISGIN